MGVASLIAPERVTLDFVLCTEGFLPQRDGSESKRAFTVRGYMKDGSSLTLGLFENLESACQIGSAVADKNDCHFRLWMQPIEPR